MSVMGLKTCNLDLHGHIGLDCDCDFFATTFELFGILAMNEVM